MASATAWRPLEDASLLKSLDENLLMLVLEQLPPTGIALLSAVDPLLASPSQDAIVIVEAGDLQRGNPLRLACEKARTALVVPCYGDAARAFLGINT